MNTHFFAVSMPGVLAKRYFIGTLIGQTLKVTRVQCSHPGDDLTEVNRNATLVFDKPVDRVLESDNEPEWKICKQCKEEKPISSFWRTGERHRFNLCSECLRNKRKARLNDQKEARNAQRSNAAV